jgi:Glycosyl transferase family 41
VRAAGIPEFVCESAEKYVETAVHYGNDRAALQPLQTRLRAQRDTCTLFDMPSLVRHLEGLYAEMWTAHQNGNLPQPRLENLDVYLEVGASQAPDATDLQTLSDAAYTELWNSRLARRHAHRPLTADTRLLSPALLASWAQR